MNIYVVISVQYILSYYDFKSSTTAELQTCMG